mmetsp:Transcript_33194/g.56802  ORF Transcript_33194/g.56802 Transcript_33194/m.56802 type:complete len:83 (-) Transcript_33194:861-1109(-)
MVQQKKSIKGMPTTGRIATQTTPITPRAQAQAGGQVTQQAMASMLSPRQGPMQGMQSAATARGPAMLLNAHQITMNPTKRNT